MSRITAAGGEPGLPGEASLFFLGFFLMGHSWARSVQVRHFTRLFTVNVEVAVCQTYLVWGFIGKVKPDQSTTNQQTAGRADVPGPHPERPPQGSPAARGPRLWSRHLRACSWRLPSSRLRGLLHATPQTPLWVPCAPCLTVLWGPQCLPSWAEASQGSRSFSVFLSTRRVIAPHPASPGT